ncbi:Mitochondrial inner membrane protease ATP23 [Metarhizium rileyi]|uniref:Mitochondrial inner membrane protease ATP23 n=1 Tax=Metarhizium rileyi (strain RCEF 4871) TaxID=1649241 RepID=A0A167DZ81_METRR|nr:Mitochondrial inner membrane protease ATP23 [Metarhizium rileyi RCEF 4871]TWU76738.1 Mitochondrial inner membrane protease atp23 [Metarhizium rileyi]
MASPNATPPSTSTSAAASPKVVAPADAPSDANLPNRPKQLVNDPARTGFDPEMKWWMNYFKILSNQMTPEGKFHYREWRYKVHEERDCKRCEEYKDWLFTYSPVVRYLSDRIQDLNGKLDRSNIHCRRCPSFLAEDGTQNRQSGGFDSNRGILICANEIRDRKHMEDTMAHEMVHAWDHLRWKMDWIGDKDLKHAACTEIRASMLSGECRWTREAFTRGQWSITQQFQNCVRRRAIQSVMGRPRCKDDVQATKVVNEVWDSCFSDTRPFDEVYR